MSSAIVRNWWKEFSTDCAGWALIGMKDRISNLSGLICIARPRKNLSLQARLIFAIARRRNMPAATPWKKPTTRKKRRVRGGVRGAAAAEAKPACGVGKQPLVSAVRRGPRRKL